MKFKSNILLPQGFQDVLPPEAERETRTISRLLRSFKSFGYEQVKPPLMEFESSVKTGGTSGLDIAAFHVMDPLSHQMMVLRPDITAQIARMAATRFIDSPKPLRLCYGGQVLRVKSDAKSGERQLAQVGVELIGEEDISSDIEVVSLAGEALLKLGLKFISVDFSLPQLAKIIMDQYQIPEKLRVNLKSYINRKDVTNLLSSGEVGKILAPLIESSGNAKDSIKSIRGFDISKQIKNQCDMLENIIDEIGRNIPELKFTIDLLEYRGFEYHTGVSFSIFSKDSPRELGRGGRYQIFSDKGNLEATGFSLWVGALDKALPRLKAKSKLYVPYGAEYSKAQTLRDQGYRTISGLKKEKDIESEAKRLGCNLIYQDGKIIKTPV